MNRKQEAIDLIRLYSQYSPQEWNGWLTKCYKNQDLNELSRTLYAVQAGMDHMAKQKLTGEVFSVWFVRLTRSIEKTMKQIIRQKYPSPLDNPAYKGVPEDQLKFIAIKRKRDQELEKFIRKVSF